MIFFSAFIFRAGVRCRGQARAGKRRLFDQAAAHQDGGAPEAHKGEA